MDRNCILENVQLIGGGLLFYPYSDRALRKINCLNDWNVFVWKNCTILIRRNYRYFSSFLALDRTRRNCTIGMSNFFQDCLLHIAIILLFEHCIIIFMSHVIGKIIPFFLLGLFIVIFLWAELEVNLLGHPLCLLLFLY